MKRSVAMMLVFLFILAACNNGSLPTGNNGSIPPASRLPDEIRLSSSSLTLLVGGTGTLTATVLPTDAANKSVKWTSADSKVASVDPSNGTVIAHAAGKTVITATTEAGGKMATCTVSVNEAPSETAPAPTSISLFPPSITLDVGDTDTLVVTVTPTNAAKDVNWKSGNPTVVMVDSNGKITAKSEGKATVYALTVVGEKQASCDITVNKKPDPILPIPNTVKAVLGHGYDITSHYAYSPDIKPVAVLDLDKLLQAQQVQEDSNLRYSEFETITGKDINEYMKNISAKVSYSAKANLLKLVSFSGEVGVNFDIERTKKGEYAFTTSTSRIVTGAYKVENKYGLDAYFTQDFTNDLGTLNSSQLINKYGTHVMLGAVLGARVDYHLSVAKKEQNNITNLEAYAKAKAEASYKGIGAGKSASAEVDMNFAQYFYTKETHEKTRVFGGKSQYGQFIQNKQDYDKWIESIGGNEIWIDYYPQSLVPLSDLVTDKSRSDAIAQAIENYCKGKEIIVSPFVVSPPIDNTVKPITTVFKTIRTEKIKISDKDCLDQHFDVVNFNVFDINLAAKKQEGYKTVSFYIQLNVREIDDGYQYLFLFSSPTKSNDYLLSGLQFEHSPGKKDGNWWVHYESELKFENVSLDKFSNNEFVIRYGASGDWGDDWENKDLKIKLVMKK